MSQCFSFLQLQVTASVKKKMQSHCRRWLVRRDFLSQKQAALRIQRAFKAMMCLKAFYSCKCAAIEIQRFVRGRNARTRLLGTHNVFSLNSLLLNSISCKQYDLVCH